MNPMNHAALLERAFTGDRSLDGLFVVGVRTTGIYCRPSCTPPRRPKLEHRAYFTDTRAARDAGFRACKLCRPDGLSPLEREQALVNALVAHTAEFSSVADMAGAANISQTKLYRLFKTHRGVTPLEVLNRVRVEHACKQLEGTLEPVSRIALEVGFGSLSAFNANFKRLMQVSPQDYRRLRAA
jgi:AraC family transcriptional regulator of adaptative response / DNA-3-methyladenine glycosylase II